jgi:hypothetical protein
MMMQLKTAQRRKIWGRKERMIRHMDLENGGSCKYFVVENHKFCFLRNHIFYFAVFISFP